MNVAPDTQATWIEVDSDLDLGIGTAGRIPAKWVHNMLFGRFIPGAYIAYRLHPFGEDTQLVEWQVNPFGDPCHGWARPPWMLAYTPVFGHSLLNEDGPLQCIVSWRPGWTEPVAKRFWDGFHRWDPDARRFRRLCQKPWCGLR